jgi:hypothetical protein
MEETVIIIVLKVLGVALAVGFLGILAEKMADWETRK